MGSATSPEAGAAGHLAGVADGVRVLPFTDRRPAGSPSEVVVPTAVPVEPRGAKHELADRLHEKMRRHAGPVICALLDERPGPHGVVEIMLNPDGRLWVERLGGSMEVCGRMSAEQAESFIATVAAAHKTTATRDRPILECELPLDGSRFEAVLPPVVAAPTFTVRRRAVQVYTLADYVTAGIMTERQASAIRRAVAEKHNILVAGGTGTGKTTLLNAIIGEIAERFPADRLVLLEEVTEIQCESENVVAMKTSADVDLLRLLKTTMRLRPDRILVGEVRGAEALTLVKTWNTGHPGGAATVHANSAKEALLRLESLIAEATAAPMERLIGAAVNVVVALERTTTGRRVRDLVRVHGYDGREYLTTLVED